MYSNMYCMLLQYIKMASECTKHMQCTSYVKFSCTQIMYAMDTPNRTWKATTQNICNSCWYTWKAAQECLQEASLAVTSEHEGLAHGLPHYPSMGQPKQVDRPAGYTTCPSNQIGWRMRFVVQVSMHVNPTEVSPIGTASVLFQFIQWGNGFKAM